MIEAKKPLERTFRVADLRAATQGKDLVGVLAISAVYLFLLAGKRLLLDWDEAIYADIAREFTRGLTQLAPYWNYHPWLERTPLFEWFTAGLFALFGVSNGTARAVSALAGCAAVALCFHWVRQLHGRTAAWIAALVLLTTHAFFYQARFGTTDMLLSLWMLFSVYGIFLIGRGELRGWYAFWIGLGLGIMTKSAGPAPVLLTMLLVAIKDRWRFPIHFRRQFFFGLMLFAAIVLPWHVYMFVRFGQAFFNDYIIRQLLTRSLRPLEGHAGGPLFYLATIAKSAFPWSIVLLVSVVRMLRERRAGVAECYAAVVLLFYTLVKTKLPWYITPFYPAMAIAAAPDLKRILPRPRIALPVFFAVGLVALLWVDLCRPYPRSDVTLIAAHSHAPGGQLILCSDRYILDIPAPLFYADRFTLQAYVNHRPDEIEGQGKIDPVTNDPKFRDPKPLSSVVSTKESLLLTESTLVPDIMTVYHFQPIANDNRFTLGIVRSR